jgi:DNA-binding PadR family transcriptional regulator
MKEKAVSPSGDREPTRTRPCVAGPGRALARLEPWLLLLLAERPAHGYELLERLDTLPEAPHADRGHLYRSLRRLEGEGLVASSWQTPVSGPPRREYTLTEDGRLALNGWAAHIRRALTRLEVFLQRCDALANKRQERETEKGPTCRR